MVSIQAPRLETLDLFGPTAELSSSQMCGVQVVSPNTLITFLTYAHTHADDLCVNGTNLLNPSLHYL